MTAAAAHSTSSHQQLAPSALSSTQPSAAAAASLQPAPSLPVLLSGIDETQRFLDQYPTSMYSKMDALTQQQESAVEARIADAVRAVTRSAEERAKEQQSQLASVIASAEAAEKTAAADAQAELTALRAEHEPHKSAVRSLLASLPLEASSALSESASPAAAFSNSSSVAATRPPAGSKLESFSGSASTRLAEHVDDELGIELAEDAHMYTTS